MKTIFYLSLIFCLVLLGSCEQNGDDGYYDNQYRIYFPQDSIHYSFGDKPVEMEHYTVRVPVNILGLPTREGMKLKVAVDGEKSTAPAGCYTPIPEEITVGGDSVVAYVPVELIRKEIPSETDTTFRLVLKLESNADFELGIRERLTATVTFGNFLAEPTWWVGLQDFFLGPYQKEKYQKLMELWGGPISEDDFYMESARIVSLSKEMYDYFQLHPEYGMIFPEYVFWPYE